VRLETARVINYKSFADSGQLHLEHGFNVIVGRNNIGKTALADAVGLRFPNTPHRSLSTIPIGGAPRDPMSRVEASIRLEVEELRELLTTALPNFVVPTDPSNTDAGEVWLQTVLSQGLTINAVFSQDRLVEVPTTTDPISLPRVAFLPFTLDPSGQPVRQGGVVHGVPGDPAELIPTLASIFVERLYSFSAVRFGIDENPIGANRLLAPNASNLVQVLDLLSRSNPMSWLRYFRDVRTVLPELQAMTFVPSDRGGGVVRAMLWNVDPATERDDLAVPLSESGTGVGQVLAILYVVFASDYPRTIVIDEPQSFLHPGTVRKLFEILKSYPQHQYVITTHSPNAVTAADLNALFLVRKHGEQSVVEQ
jgi:hypothetical protein